MNKRTLGLLLLVFALLAVLPAAVIAAPPGQDAGTAYTVQRDDWLSKIAEKEYGDVLAYPAIVYYNNLRATEDDTYVTIDNPDLIEVGWTIYVPTAEEATAFLSGTVAEVEDTLGSVTVGAGEPIHIAYMLTTSGATAFLGADSLGAIEIAVEERGQIKGHDILLTGEDSLCSAEGGQTAAVRVAADPTVLAVIGTNCSSSATAAIETISGAGLLMVSPSNTAPALTDPNGTWQPGYFRTAHNDQFQGRVAAEYAFNELGALTAATIHDGSPYADQLQQVFVQVFEELGGTVTFQGAVNVGDTDMVPILTTIGADAPDVLYYPIFEPEGPFITSQSEGVPGLEETILMGADGLLSVSFAPAAGPNAEGMYLSGPYVSGDAYDAFLVKYEEHTGGPPPAGFAAHAYDATNMVFDAIDSVAVEQEDGSLSIGRQALRDAMAATANYNGLTGNLTCDRFGDCATGEALGIYQLSADQIASEDNWPPPVVYTP
jgi:branched-chain amino acid transport system substrate-binding protein